MIRTAEQLLMDQDMSSPNPKPGKTSNEFTVEVVKRFYKSKEVSRLMPFKKDYILTKVSGVKVHEQKQLLLCNFKDLYSHFKNSHPRVKVGFSKFASLCPRNYYDRCKWCTQCVCVCVYNSPKCEVNVGSLQNI
jgi:hypothetical protein